MYYIVSLKHTSKNDKYFTLWGPNNAGYHYSKEMSGLYEEYQDRYHNSEGNMPITKELADSLFEKVDYYGEEKHMILNNTKNRKALGVKLNKSGYWVLGKGGEGK